MERKINTEEKVTGNETANKTGLIPAQGIRESIKTFGTEELGSTINEITFEGVRIFHSHSKLKEPFTIHSVTDFPNFQMHFMLEGQSTTLDKGKRIHELPANQFAAGYSQYTEGTYLLESKSQQNFEIRLTEKFFTRLIDEDSRVLSQLAEKIQKKEASGLVPHNLMILPAMKTAIHDILQCQRKGHVKCLFVEAKILEIFSLLLEQVEDQHFLKPSSLNRQDVDKIYAAKDLLERNVCESFTLLDLARQVGLNDFKLKKGFRELFDTTVFGYLQDLRMSMAKRMLLEEKKTVWQVADVLGYSHAHHFSQAFRKKFGYLPSAIK